MRTYGRINFRNRLRVSLPCVRTLTIIPSLEERGLIKTVTSENLDKKASDNIISLYCGVDPTAASLHIGNLATLLPVLHFYLRGHNVYTLVGGATGEAGDPAGKSTARDVLEQQALSKNVRTLSDQLGRFFRNAKEYAFSRGYVESRIGTMNVINNVEWFRELSFMDFMRVVGRNVRLSAMLARDSVKGRTAATGNAGLSYAEFSYQLMQAYDFWHLYRAKGVTLQIGGSDQYGNITAGIDLVNRLQKQHASNHVEVYGLTVPLLTTSSGEKFGKSAGNAIWLDPNMTSPFELYQHFFKTFDTDLEKYLKLFTLLPIQRIETLMAMHHADPSKRVANRELARELVVLIHGRVAYEKTEVANRILFPGDFTDHDEPLSARRIMEVFKGDRALSTMPAAQIIDKQLASVLRDCSITKSANEALRLIENGGVRVGNRQISSGKDTVQRNWLLDDQLLVLRIGKNKCRFIALE